MTVSPMAWMLTIALVAGLLLFDFFFHVRREPEKLKARLARTHASHASEPA